MTSLQDVRKFRGPKNLVLRLLERGARPTKSFQESKWRKLPACDGLGNPSNAIRSRIASWKLTPPQIGVGLPTPPWQRRPVVGQLRIHIQMSIGHTQRRMVP